MAEPVAGPGGAQLMNEPLAEPVAEPMSEPKAEPMELRDRVAVITGAAGGIGLSMAKAALDHGMRVLIADIDEARAEAEAAALRRDGADITAEGCDVRDLGNVEALRDSALGVFGRVDLVCNNAGVGLARPITDCSAGDWRLVVDVNIGGVVNGVRAFVPLLIEQGSGHVSATASLSGLVADPDLSIYNLTKFAVVGLMESLGHELRRDHPGVGASVLCPGPVATDLIATSAQLREHAAQRSEAAPAAAPQADELNAAVGDYLARGMHPDEVGRIAIDGIAEGRFWLITHPELTHELLDARHAAMLDGGRLADLPDDWTDQ